MNSKARTDLALEAQRMWLEEYGSAGELKGVQSHEETLNGFKVTTVDITDSEGEAALGKPVGSYVTVELDALLRREDGAFPAACSVIAEKLRELLKLEENGSVLVAGLGNREITPDAVGPDSVDNIMVTRHLKAHMPGDFAAFREVAAMKSGVLGTTGMESGDVIKAACGVCRPSAVVAVDALAAREPGLLCRTVQIADSGIVPGSGVGNARQALSRDTLGVPVIAVGVPTVVDAATLCGGENSVSEMFVTDRGIDKKVKDVSKLIGYSLNLALHKGLTIEDIDMFLS